MELPAKRSTWHFKPLEIEDMPLFHRWVHQPHIYEWWYEDALPLDQLIERYRPDIEGAGTAHCFIAERNGEPFGYVQWYRIGDESEWTPPSIKIDGKDVAVDLYVGDPDGVGKGLGTEMLVRFLADVVFPAAPDAENCWIDPDTPNPRAIRSYQKAGFQPIAVAERMVEGKLDVALIMRLPRDGFFGS